MFAVCQPDPDIRARAVAAVERLVAAQERRKPNSFAAQRSQ
jgi:hypothetical protein